MARKIAKIPKTVVGRTSKLLSVGASLLGREITGRVGSRLVSKSSDGGSGLTGVSLETRVRQAQELVDTLGQMKGAAMKVGQLLSLELSDFLPVEVTTVLRQLHDDSTMMPPADVERILKDQWGEERYARVENLSSEPIAAASIGQVHRATIDGRDVAIKVQFEGVAGSIDADLALMRKIASSWARLQGKHIPLDAVFDEVAASLRDEVDYLKEAAAVERYGRAFANDERYRIPEVLNEWSTQTVLTLTFEEGVKLGDWLETADVGERQSFCQNMFELLLKEFFELGLVQTDPNYGNFLYRPRDGRIVLLDFGATRAYAPEFRNELRDMLRLAFAGDRQGALAECFRLGYLSEREDLETRECFLDLLDSILDVFTEDLQPFDFADLDYLGRMREQTFGLIKRIKYSAPARNVIFVDRKFGGIFHLLKDAGCRMDLAKYWRQVMEMKIDKAA